MEIRRARQSLANNYVPKLELGNEVFTIPFT
jgi:hypothetical protein